MHQADLFSSLPVRDRTGGLCTGGLPALAVALNVVRGREHGFDFGYCLDAPTFVPAGGVRSYWDEFSQQTVLLASSSR